MALTLLDTGVLVALFDKDDKYHLDYVNFIKNNRSLLTTTLANITEAMFLLSFSIQAQKNLLTWLSLGVIYVQHIEVKNFVKVADLMINYADLPMDFADACLVFLAEECHITKIATIDSDFQIYRIHGKKIFNYVL